MAIKKRSILIVDDDMDICSTLKDIFRDKGYEAETASSRIEAVKMVEKRPYDVALVDLVLEKGGGGMDVVKRIRELCQNILLYIMTAYTKEDLIKEAFDNGVLKLFKKPFDLEKMLADISEQVAKKR